MMNSTSDGNDAGLGVQPLDAARAKTAAVEARRLLVASHGVGMCGVGGLLLAFMLFRMIEQAGYIVTQRISAILLIGMGSWLLMGGAWLRNRRRRQGVFAVLKGESVGDSKLSKEDVATVLVGALIGAGVIAGMILVPSIDPGAPSAGHANLWTPLICVIVALGVLLRAVHCRLWEFAMGSMGFLSSAALFVWLPGHQDWAGFLPMGIGMLLTGLMLHVRWSRWVKALPDAEPDVTAHAN